MESVYSAKFFTNNDFSFIDVHNERPFYQNADVLLKLLQMWQDIRLTNPNGHNQFLGDMFEGFLDQGVKQSEGQFFTPMPICRFILMSLPLESLVRDTPTPPMAIDYACGAGHFLTELALQLQPLLEQHKPLVNPAEYHKSMVGIEKEYRLSKVAKVSAFMYGQQGIQVCYGDGLVNSHEAFPDIRDGHFDLLVANPPYSVRGFLETLPEEERMRTRSPTPSTTPRPPTASKPSLSSAPNNSSRPVAWPPSSALVDPLQRRLHLHPRPRNPVAVFRYRRHRRIRQRYIWKNRHQHRHPVPAPQADPARPRRALPRTGGGMFKGLCHQQAKQAIYKDGHLIEQYCAHINVPLADYQSLLRGEAEGSWKQQEHFQPYHDKFDKSTELDNLRKQKKFKALSKAEQTAEIAKRYLGYVQTIERDKLYHFCLASDQANPVLIIPVRPEPRRSSNSSVMSGPAPRGMKASS